MPLKQQFYINDGNQLRELALAARFIPLYLVNQ